MRATAHCIAVAAVTLLLALPPLTQAATLCTDDQIAAFKPYNEDSLTAPGCDIVTFRTCSDTCLEARQQAAKHAPDCRASGRSTSYLDDAKDRVKRCEDMRTDMANKYAPQIVRSAPQCAADVASKFEKDDAYSDCDDLATKNCTDACLKIIEDKITTAPFCTEEFEDYTLGEYAKYVLVNCLNTRKESLKENKVLNTVAGATGKSESASAATTALGTISVVVSSVVALVVLLN